MFVTSVFLEHAYVPFVHAEWRSLRDLSLNHMPVSESQLTHIGQTLTALRSLTIRGLTNALTCSSLACLNNLVALTSLSIDKICLSSSDAFEIAQSSCLRNLELSGARLSREAFASLNALSRLESLYVWGTGGLLR